MSFKRQIYEILQSGYFVVGKRNLAWEESRTPMHKGIKNCPGGVLKCVNMQVRITELVNFLP